MTVASMTGFARAQGVLGPWSFSWELKSVNSRGLDLRLRTPPALDWIEVGARKAITGRLTRGAVSATLTARRVDEAPPMQVNRAVLDQLLAALDDVPLHANLRPAALDGLLTLPGVIEIVHREEDETQRAALETQILDALEKALDALVATREEEGAALLAVLRERLGRITALTDAADVLPARQPEAIRARLAQQIARLLENVDTLDPNRLHQEAVLLAVKGDIREELDRLRAHVAGAAELLAKGGPVGRRLDFLAQEFGRETNTLCAKSNDPTLTAIGLDLRIEVEQWREQVQNIE
jgi:uncharacterized protein (TIGR00255 family)